MFTLTDPPEFRAFDPDGEIRFSRRHLPHWRQEGATYFVTFRTADSIPSAKAHELRLLKRELDLVPDEERSRLESAWREFMKLMERYLDEGHGACPLRKPSLSAIVANAMHHFDGERYALFAFAVMPNHAHVVLRPLGENTLGEILKSWKSFSARLINKELGGEGAFWQAESYDRIVRDGEELFRIVQYVGRNGEKAGLSEGDFRRWIRSEWHQAGWGFVG